MCVTQEVDLLRSLNYNAYSVEDFPYIDYFNTIKSQKRKAGNQKGQHKDREFIDAICAFDIETTNLNEVRHSIMYIWQFCIEDKIVIGRTWQEFLTFVENLREYRRREKQKLVVYVHNLSFEFQFLSGIYDFKKEEVFALDTRKPCKVQFMDFIEFRCSYIHSNMSLYEFTHKMGAEHGKKLGADYDYNKLRFSDTPLTVEELEYCVDDVLGLVEALKIEMKHDNDNLYSIPLTSTGYVRRDIKREINKTCKWLRKINIPTFEIYDQLRNAFRGGNTHASRFFAGHELENVNSYDISSCYPFQILTKKFPLKPFTKVTEKNTNFNTVLDYLSKGKALLIDFEVFDLKLKKNVPCPYISISKCSEIDFYTLEMENSKRKKTDFMSVDNGRVIACKHLRLTMNDIDFKIFIDQYEGEILIKNLYYSYYQEMPKGIKEQVLFYFKEKTKYKNAKGEEEVYYMKQKNKLNSIYGLFAQNPLQITSSFSCGEWDLAYEKPLEELLNDYNKKSYFPYSIGVWVTSYARAQLQELIDLVGYKQFVYCDTDSVKFIGEVDIEKLNSKYRKEADKYNAYCDYNGKRYYLGQYEQEHAYKRFKTLGAKKYIYQYDDEKIYCTIAGVRKNSVYNSAGEVYQYGGGDELMKKGGFSEFKEGFIFKLAGGNEARYNDIEPIEYTRQDGKKELITRNVFIHDGEYRLDTTEEYYNLIHSEEIEELFKSFFKYAKERSKYENV